MRIVMLTDDGKSVDRRILLEAESLIDEGHEVIVVARQDGSAPAGDRLGRVKVLWIDLDLGYLNGTYDGTGLDRPFEKEEGDADRGASLARLREQMVQVGVWRMTAELDAAQDRRILENGTGLLTRVRALSSLAWRSFTSKRSRQAWNLEADRFQEASASPVQDFSDLPEMNIWERALFFRTLYLDPDIIHVHDLPQLLAGVYAKKALNVPLIYDAHEVYPQISTLTPAETKMLHDKEGLLLKYCDIRITVNPFCSQLMEYAYGCKPFDIIMNATGGESLGHLSSSPQNRLRERLSLPADAKILMYQGWIADVGRGLVELVKAFPKIREEVHLVMMGYGNIDEFKELARASGVADRVHLLPPVPWDELVSWSAEADAGIIPYQPVDFNHRVCSPNKLFEFIAARLPIICNDLPFLRQVVEGEGFGVVHDMSSSRAMAEAINKAFDPRMGRLRAAKKALLEKGADWEWPVEADKLKRLYARLPLPARYEGLAVQPKAMMDLDCLVAAGAKAVQ